MQSKAYNFLCLSEIHSLSAYGITNRLELNDITKTDPLGDCGGMRLCPPLSQGLNLIIRYIQSSFYFLDLDLILNSNVSIFLRLNSNVSIFLRHPLIIIVYQAILHPEQDRVLTIRENARLQGFPDYYKLFGPVKQRWINNIKP